MKAKDRLIALYRGGKLEDEDQLQLESMLAEDVIQLEELGLQEEVMTHLAAGKDVSETQAMDDRFYAFLEKQDTPQPKTRIFPLRISRNQSLIAAVVGILLAFWGGLKLGALDTKAGNSGTQQELLSSMLETEDVSDRIHLISTHQIDKKLDKQVFDALLFSLINDESNNVRLAALEVLSQFNEEERVRESLIRSISHQHSTIVLVEIAQVLGQGGKALSSDEFFTYIDKEMHPALQRNLREALSRL